MNRRSRFSTFIPASLWKRSACVVLIGWDAWRRVLYPRLLVSVSPSGPSRELDTSIEPISKLSKILIWMEPSSSPASSTSTESPGFFTGEWNIESRDTLLLNTSSLDIPLAWIVPTRRKRLTYSSPVDGSVLSFGSEPSMSSRASSRGRSSLRNPR
ncbi:hypothetical protein H113_00503 [Trichophyton rubrum MR1459]|uniref:Uncharacterized protein n=1 Tax=Trichophyton rubrum (strain ATCC MYA-4607 / CBS 118892) TaxID=559305 RepID=A0A080WPX4_TRIRC|nr:uncharacterized protein TERG_12649 [Trichophyton rubrum CBS 118892]EZF99902.1 hypothetical protein H113_00503 [Trichophyton rubrum MR1459]EZG10801.1 hypothetical protein H106_00380 [Trichophyton rubrum CBS 735.88]KFL62957.1 hypothetical protein TERG_12649 [Trichophyton rubrum CBS 118892]